VKGHEMINIENKLDELKSYFKNNKDILAVWIVGSYGTEYQRDDSDIDFAILYNSDIDIMKEMKYEGEISDIIKFENIDTINLKRAPITLQFKTIKEGRSIFEEDFVKVSDYIELVLKIYYDARYYIDAFDRDYYGDFNSEV
jgi:predicted nucleotidyltransferase